MDVVFGSSTLMKLAWIGSCHHAHLLVLKELKDDATLESAHLELQDDECLVIIHFYTTPSSLSHGDLDFDPRSDLSQGGEMMRSILWTSPCQEPIWQVTRATSISHTLR